MSPLKFILTVLLVVLTAAGAASATCSNATLNGVYGYYHGRPDGIGGQRALVGQMIADGHGNLTGSWTTSLNGTISAGTFTGTYSIAKHCTGSFTLSNEDESPADFSFTLDDSHKGFQILQTYTENADCTGTIQITPQGMAATNFNTVVVNGGKELLLIETDNDTVVAGTAQQ